MTELVNKGFGLMALLALALMALASIAFAQGAGAQSSAEVSAAILSTNLNYTDAYAAGSASVKAGVPILYTAHASLSADAKAAIQAQGVKKVYIVGGPLAVSSEVEAELKALGVEVVRLWGYVWYGTAAEIAKAFWAEGSAEVVIAAYDHSKFEARTSYRVLASAKALAASKGLPLLMVSVEGVPSVTAEAVGFLGAKKAFVVGELSAAARTELEGLGVEVELVGGADAGVTERDVRAKIDAEAKAHGKGVDLVVIAAKEFRHALHGAFVPSEHSVVVMVSSESEAGAAVEAAKSRNAARVLIVGDAELAVKVKDAMVAAGVNASIEVRAGGAEKSAAENFEREKPRFRERLAKFKAEVQDFRAKVVARIPSLIEAVRDRIVEIKAEAEAEGELDAELETRLAQGQADVDAAARLSSEGNFYAAAELLVKVGNDLELRHWAQGSVKIRSENIDHEARTTVKSRVTAAAMESLKVRLSFLKSELEAGVEAGASAGLNEDASFKAHVAAAENAVARLESALESGNASAAFGASVSASHAILNVKASASAKSSNGESLRKRLLEGIQDFKSGFKTEVMQRLETRASIEVEGFSKFEYRVRSGASAETSGELRVSSDEIEFTGTAGLSNPCFKLSAAKSVNVETRVLSIDVKSEATGDACIQVVANSKFEGELELEGLGVEGDWTVELVYNGQVLDSERVTFEASAETSAKAEIESSTETDSTGTSTRVRVRVG